MAKQKITVVTRSSAKTEFRVVCHGMCEGIFLERMLRELKVPWTVLWHYNVITSQQLISRKEPCAPSKNTYVEFDRHFIKEKLEEGLLKLVYISIDHQIPDIVTMALPRISFDSLK